MENTGYRASACGPNCGDNLDHGTVWFTTAGASFQGSTGAFTLPLEGLKMERAGATGDTIRLSHPQHDGWFISTTNLAVLNDPVLRGQGNLRASVKTGKRKTCCCLGGCLAIILAVVLLVAAISASKDLIVGGLVEHFPQELEQKVGDALFEGTIMQAQLIDDKELIAGLNAIARPVLDAIPDSEGFTSFTLHFSRDKEPNAFAMPGGHIIVNTGLITLADTPEQVAGVIAHEAGHATLRHGLQSIINRLGVAAVLQVLAGDAGGLAGILAEGGGFLMNQKYSRDFERQADEKAWQYMMAANVNPRGLVEFFDKLKSVSGAAVPDILSTHPHTDDRMAVIEKKLESLPDNTQWRTFDLDFAKFKEEATAEHQ